MRQAKSFLNHINLLQSVMNHKRKLLSPMVSAAVVLIVVTNFCILQILGKSAHSASELISAIWPLALPSSVAVILIMSTLYQTVQELMDELELRRVEAAREAQYDPLTGVANKRLLEQRVDQAIARFRRSGEKLCVLMVDLDNFKRINDLLGHQVGDLLLKEAATRLASLVRETDTVARYGGDEFLILQTDVKSHADVRRLCLRVAEALQLPYVLGGREIRLAASIGAAVATNRFESANDYLRAADVALYEAKASGRNCYRFFSEELDSKLRRADKLEKDLKIALATGDGISVHFQPQLDASGAVVGAEALFRWMHHEFGEIAALEAISIAEDCGLIHTLGEQVLRKAARAALRWPRLSIAVNVSPAQFSRDGNLPETLQRVLKEQGVCPSQIELEITERLFMEDRADCEEQLVRLREYGFRLALDDFGTGYSSLSYLRRFKVDRLKLDRSFAMEAELHQSVAIVRAAVVLAHSLGLEVVAEGIETDVQEAVALEAGCDALQGYRYGAPMTEEQFAKYLEQASSAAA